MGRHFRAAAVAAAALAVAGCSSDPAFWEAVAVGLDEAAADLEYQNANCYWAPAGGAAPWGQPAVLPRRLRLSGHLHPAGVALLAAARRPSTPS
ncbi:MAG: hypothetical protein KL785_00315 [Brevundimonas sp.]|nr:hypothetical protein [Brevundimonas sp.]